MSESVPLRAALRGQFGEKAGVYFIRTGERSGYVGQSARMSGRLARHAYNGAYTEAQVLAADVYEVAGSKLSREVQEQLLIDHYRRQGYKLDNVVNPIGEARIGRMGPGYARPPRP